MIRLGVSIGLVVLTLWGCAKATSDSTTEVFSFAGRQFQLAFSEIEEAIANESMASVESRERRGNGPLVSPRSLNEDGSLYMVPSADWTSGFFPGSLWYMYEFTGDGFWKQKAEEFTWNVEREQWNDRTHDMGFKMYCSFGNGYRITGEQTYKDILIQSANTLITRFNPIVGALRSWDHNRDKWGFPVIIDNMMNLELLFWATDVTGDSVYYHIAEAHAITTLNNHFREDYSSFHVVDYNVETGEVVNRHTHQGFAHESAWSRGQAWGLYGYTMAYRATGNTLFLEIAEKITAFIFDHPRLPLDLIPYWDFDAPEIPNAPRDASAAAVTASALYELGLLVPEKQEKYHRLANQIVDNLIKDYLAEPSGLRGFLLDHSTGHLPHNHEIDVPLVYADYYFLEALLRRKSLSESNSIFNITFAK